MWYVYFCRTQTNLFLIQFLSQPHFHPSTLFLRCHQMLSLCKTTYLLFCSVLFLGLKKKAWSSHVSIHIKMKKKLYTRCPHLCQEILRKKRAAKLDKELYPAHVFWFFLREWFLRGKDIWSRESIIWKKMESSWGLHSSKRRSAFWPLEFSQKLEQPHFCACVCREGTNLSSTLIRFYQMFCVGFDWSITQISHAQLRPMTWSNTNWASDLCGQ